MLYISLFLLLLAILFFWQSNKAEFIKVLEKRIEDLSGSGLSRVKKVIKQANNK